MKIKLKAALHHNIIEDSLYDTHFSEKGTEFYFHFVDKKLNF